MALYTTPRSIAMNKQSKVRQPAVAGTFYPASATELQAEVQRFLKGAALPELPAPVVAVMAPHAGYVFSAQVAAPAYLAMAKADFETIVIIGHDFGRQARGITAILADHDAYQTPLGPVAVDTELGQRLQAALPTVIVHNGVHAREHTIEVHLPFVKTLKPDAKILPVLFGEATPDNCRAFARALQKAAGNKKIMIMASTDLCHYPSANDARELDAKTTAIIADLDLEGLCQRQAGKGVDKPNTDTPICSAGGVGVAIAWMENYTGATVKLLAQANSGDVRGSDRSRVVGYASAAFLGQAKAASPQQSESTAQPEPAGADFILSSTACKELLSLARQRLNAAQNKELWKYKPPAELPELAELGAAFVTLTKQGRLRGCIGSVVAHAPLWRSVQDMAYAAAFEDPRFPSLTAAELPDVHIEISVLSPMRPASSAAEIVPGKHGVMVRRDGRSGLFLPQVWEQIPNRDQFLSILCQEKAGLPPNAWKDKETTLLIFTVFAFEEEK